MVEVKNSDHLVLATDTKHRNLFKIKKFQKKFQKKKSPISFFLKFHFSRPFQRFVATLSCALGLKLHDLTMWLCGNCTSSSPVKQFQILAVKSALPVTALVAWSLTLTHHTAPLCPKKVPTQSPVFPCLSIGFPSLQAESKKYPSCVIPEKSKSTTGRVWPVHVSGVCRCGPPLPLLAAPAPTFRDGRGVGTVLKKERIKKRVFGHKMPKMACF